MTTLRTHIGVMPPEPVRIGWRGFCANGHPQNESTVRWRLRDRRDRPDGRGGSGPRWERDCLVCKQVQDGNRRSAMRAQSWLPGATS